ncbi:hypothetical protein PC111_g18275 [Phytophthora cactorum]|nr:hypothetical protein PC111_g18275 [Phytophthora cactorum]
MPFWHLSGCAQWCRDRGGTAVRFPQYTNIFPANAASQPRQASDPSAFLEDLYTRLEGFPPGKHRKHPVRLFGAFVHIQQTHLDDAKPHRIRATIGDSDQLEYYLRAFVSGDPNGHRVAIVTRVDTYKDVGFPISVDTGEAIPLDMMTKRVADRFSNEFTPEATKWRKIRT